MESNQTIPPPRMFDGGLLAASITKSIKVNILSQTIPPPRMFADGLPY